MASETEAPTSGVTKSAAEQVESTKLSLDQLDFVTLINMHYSKFGSLLTAELAYEKYNLPVGQFEKFMSNPKVRSALKQYDIPLERFEAVLKDPDNWQANVLSPVQMLAIETMLDMTDQRSDKKKLQDLNISTRTWNKWMRDPLFQETVQARVDNLLHKEGVHIAGMALMDRVATGDTKALEFYYEFIGKFTRKSASPESSNAINFQNVVAKMLEVIVEEADPETAFRIGERFKTIMASQNIAQQLLEDSENEIIVPPTAPSRELTPEVQELMERTGGNS